MPPEVLKLAIELISPFEGCAKKGRDGRIYPYLDRLAKPNVWTIGYGRTYGVSENTPPITIEEAKLELAIGASKYGSACLKLSPILVAHPNKWAAVTSWAWNCGVGAYKVSRLRKAIDQGDFNAACRFMLRPNTAGGVVYRGLTRRRELEAFVFMT